jgi:hypothetical protein
MFTPYIPRGIDRMYPAPLLGDEVEAEDIIEVIPRSEWNGRRALGAVEEV